MKLSLIFIFFVIATLSAYPQKQKMQFSRFFNSFYYRGPWSLTFGGGLAAYRGTLCGRPECNTFKPVLSVGANYRIWPHIAFGTELNFFQLQAHGWGGLYVNSFTSANLDIRPYIRYYLVDDVITRTSHKVNQKTVKPYLQIGIGAVYYSSQSYVFNTSDNSRVLSEGQKKSGIAIALPFTGGLCFTFSSRLRLLSELSYIFTVSDYLDNAHVKRNTLLGLKDSYAMANIKLQISFLSKK
jgi:hypothetical protein